MALLGKPAIGSLRQTFLVAGRRGEALCVHPPLAGFPVLFDLAMSRKLYCKALNKRNNVLQYRFSPNACTLEARVQHSTQTLWKKLFKYNLFVQMCLNFLACSEDDSTVFRVITSLPPLGRPKADQSCRLNTPIPAHNF